jgi:prepilin-type N-terminal cleavage/methylation domain-containing protein/prepilin-type processing-associated H-X9-DG protein
MRSQRTSQLSRRPPRGRPAFTLIELLVVIAIIALLMAILLPTLARARKHAQGVVCQSNLHQWGTRLATYAVENEGRLWHWGHGAYPDAWGGWWWWDFGVANPTKAQRNHDIDDILHCPLAAKPASELGYWSGMGGTFLAWETISADGQLVPTSYTVTSGVHPWYTENRADPGNFQSRWVSVYVKGAAFVPALLDSSSEWDKRHHAEDPPPPYDAVPIRGVESSWHTFCINRHEGSVNGLFLDCSVRKVGLKELWTLRWDPSFDTAGPWTKAGGVRPEDWPAWMRKFKDY